MAGGLCVVFTATTLGCATAPPKDPEAGASEVIRPHRLERLGVFEPRPAGRRDVIDYVGIDRILKNIVVLSGPSLRRRAIRPRPSTGTRIVLGHVSPFRLEGNKVTFSRMTPAQRDAVFANLEDLISFGNQVEITRLPRSAQLAYWFNLHNMLVISEILKRYPIRVPRRLKLGPQSLPFHDAPVVTIHGIALSLRDIRVGIVYRHWPDPRVMYGFFHGDLASPSIRNHAYKADTVWADLDKNAGKFVNALRGVHRRIRDPIALVSPIYGEAKAALFPVWPDDLIEHLNAFAGPSVTSLLEEAPSVAFGPYEERIADMVGGEASMPSRMVSMSALLSGSPYHRMVGEFVVKYQLLARRLRHGTVTVEDLSSDDETSKDEDGDDG